ncbi:alpha/beta hydrolase [Nocardiopsis sp. Huas11]|uniref:alpha/beta hydrolase n=1 Tax=Nocardiopsis sp. Huas11 TaxID=2183912 RepID=UPI001F43785E|nr:alpha/beta hydrolase [Nocardiopsis sp. Huas11]
MTTVLLTGCTGAPGPGPAEEEPDDIEEAAADRAVEPGTPEAFAGQEIEWDTCYTGDDLEAAVDEGGEGDWLGALDCGTVSVPLDYADPDGRTLDLHMVRAAATGDEPLGSLVINGGGPGVTGSETLFWETMSPRVRASFDLVSFDPRGVGRSEGLECGNWDEIDRVLANIGDTDPADLTDEELVPLERAARLYAEDCAEEAGEDFLYNIGSVNVARDMDIIRDALGDDALTYLGYSYGTYVGALYAQMYPQATRALVLDGAVETEHTNAEAAYEQDVAFQESWELFVEYCVTDMAACPFDSADGAEADMDEVFAYLDAELPEVEGEPVDSWTFAWMITMALYDEYLWEDISQAIRAVRAQDEEEIDTSFSYLYEYAFGAVGASPRPRAAADEWEDSTSAMTAINCADREDPTDVEAYREAAARTTAEASFFSGGVWTVLPCAYWTETEEAPTGFTAPDAPPIVVVGTVGDPATPYAWAQRLADQLETATLVTYEGAGHTIYGYGVSSCVESELDDYLIDGTVPEEGLSCPGML